MDPKQRKQLKAWISEIRRDLHRHPELAYEEIRTTDLIDKTLTGLGIQTRTFDGVTGVLGLINNQAGGPTLALRADIDALPIQEKTGVAYASQTQGVMHACGHDTHTAIMLGVAKRLVDGGNATRIPGNLKFIFQPAEEGGAGARALIDQGVLENPDVDWIIAGHASPDLAVGTAGFFHGQSHASANRFCLTIKGVGTHGARPNQGVDPFTATAQFINATQSVVARNVDPLKAAVISIGRIQAGTASNVIPDRVEIEGTIRALESEIRNLLIRRLDEICRGLELSHGVTCRLEVDDGYPPCLCSEPVSDFMFETATRVLDADKAAWLPSSTGAEDFAFFTQKVDGAICRIGCGNAEKGIVHPLHSPLFDVDEEMLILGAEFFYQCVLDYFGIMDGNA